MVSISKAKAKRLGVPDDQRHSLTREQLTSYETGSGQYEVKNDKTFLVRDEPEEQIQEAPAITEEQVQGLPEGASATTLPGVTEREGALQPVQELKTPIQLEAEKSPVEKAIEAQLTILTSPITTALLATTLGALTLGAASIGGAITSSVGKSAISTLSKSSTGAIVGKIATNPKTIVQSTKLISKMFSNKAMIFYGGWASSVFLGKWAFAESPEGITYPLNKLADEAETPEDWAKYWEYSAAAKEIATPSIWEEIISWSPLSPIPGILRKIRGVGEGINVIDTRAEIKQRKQQEEAEGGGSSFAEERKQADEEARERELEYREEDTKYYEDIEDKKTKAKEEDREADKDYYAQVDADKRKEELRQRDVDTEYYNTKATEKRNQDLLDKAEDTAYWEGEAAKRRALELIQMAEDTAHFKQIADDARARKLQERAEDEAYWAAIKGEALDDEEAEMLKLWNSGKSALNFSWLGS